MDFILNRYRNLSVLLLVIIAQLLLLAYQVKTNKDVPLIRLWAVTTVTPVEEGLEFVRRHTIGYVEDYFVLVGVREQNERMKRDLGQLKLENNFLKNQLSTAERAKQLAAFEQETPSKTLAARVIGNGVGANSKVVFIDRGSGSGVESGMAVITPDGIVGKVVAAYPTASLVMLITDPTFAAGVISQKNRVHGTLKGQGGPKCKVEYIQNEEKVDPGEWFYTSGDDGVFPRGFPVGQVASVSNGRSAKEIYLTPSGWQGGLDEVLVVIQGVHQPVPQPQLASTPVKILPPPADEMQAPAKTASSNLTTPADKLRKEYEQIGQQENVQFGVGSKAPDFTKLGKAPPQGAGSPAGEKPGAGAKPPGTPAVRAPAQARPGEPAPPAGNAGAPQPGPTAVRPEVRTTPPSTARPSNGATGTEAPPVAKPKNPENAQPRTRPPGATPPANGQPRPDRPR